MTWDGSGNHDRIHNFSADASAGIQAQAVRFDAEFDDVSTALENCQTLTGETTPTADSPMGGFKHTGVAAATSTDNYLRADQQAQQVAIYVRDKNTTVSGTISASAAVFPTAFSDGQRVTVKVSADGSATALRAIIVNGLSANIIDNEGSAVPATRMLQDGIFDLIYDISASAFRVLTPSNQSPSNIFSAEASSQGVAFTSTGKFTAVFSAGFTAVQSHTWFYTRTGKNVMAFYDNSMTGTSDSSALLSNVNVPSSIRPGTTHKTVVEIEDGSAGREIGFVSVTATGTIQVTRVNGAGFAASGTKGLRGSNFMISWFIGDETVFVSASAGG